MTLVRIAVAVSLAAILCTHAAAQTPEQFYRGKSIDMIIGYPPAGSNDTMRADSRAIWASTSPAPQRRAEEHAGRRQLPRRQQRL